MRAWMRLLLLAGLVLACQQGRATKGGPHVEAYGVPMVLLDSLLKVPEPTADEAKGENTRLVSSLLAVTLGPFGAHRLYLGTRPRVAIVYGLTFGGFGVLVLMDLGHLLFSRDLEPFRNNDRVFMWNAPTAEEAATTPP